MCCYRASTTAEPAAANEYKDAALRTAAQTFAAPRIWLLFGLVLAGCIVYWPTVATLYEAWTDTTGLGYTHGLLVAAGCLVLLWLRRREIQATVTHPWPLAAAALAICSLAWLVSFRASVQDLHVTLFPVILWLSMAAAFGKRTALLTAPAFLLLAFGVPSWGQLAPVLQSLTIAVMRLLISMTGMTAWIHGDVIDTPVGSFIVETGCSGLHFLIVGLAVAVLYGELRQDRLRVRIAHIAVMVVLCLVANWARVFTIVVAGYQTNMRHRLITVGHYYFGWGVFVVALGIFFWLVGRYSEPLALSRQGSPAATALPIRETIRSAELERLGFLLTLAALGAAPVFSYMARVVDGVPPPPEVRFTQAQGPWSGPTVIGASPWRPQFPGAPIQQLVSYRGADGYSIEVFGAAYALQRQGEELVGSESSIIGDGVKRMREGGRVATPVGLFQEVTGTDSAGRNFLIWFQYRIGGRSFVVPIAEQLWYGMTSIAGEPTSSVVAVRAPCDATSCEPARARIEDLLAKAPVTVASGSRNAIAATRSEKNSATLKGAGA